jgi:hypothetical protein
MATLAEIRAKLKEQQEKQNGSANNGDNLIYSHWNIEEGQSALVRFLPDADTSNDFFWVERLQIKLPFAGIKGQSDKQTTVTVPCMEQWGESCPILTEIRPWFKDSSLEEVARKYWKKRSYILQGFIRENPIEEDDRENPIRKFILTPELFKLVREGIMDPEIEELPVHYERGLDFRIKKGSKGGYPDYGTSSWARKESALTGAEIAAIEKHGLFDLKNFMPKKPSDVELNVIRDMFRASVDGEAYDPAAWGNYYKPFGLKDGGSSDNSKKEETRSGHTTHTTHTTTVKESNKETPPWEDDEDNQPSVSTTSGSSSASSNSDRAQEILNKIRARKQ